MGRGSSWSTLSLRVLFLACLLLLLTSAVPAPSSAPRRGAVRAGDVAADEALFGRMCDPRRAGVPRSWCHELRYHLRRRRGSCVGAHHHHRHQHHHRPVPLPPPGGGGEEIDVRYGVAKRLVPTGPNPLHN